MMQGKLSEQRAHKCFRKSTLGWFTLGLLLLSLLAGCTVSADEAAPMATFEQSVPGGDADRGEQAIIHYGCGTCHTIAGVPGARGLVGPPLTNIGQRAIVAGMLQNNPDNLIFWIQHPQEVVPGNVMPDLGVGDQDARDIAAYLYSIP